MHAERPFYRSLVDFMTSGPVVVQVLEGRDAVALNREIMGATDPAKADPGTIRKDFAQSIEANSVHGSDSAENAEREIAFFSRQSKYAPSLGARFAGLISDQAKRQLAVWCEAGVDTRGTAVLSAPRAGAERRRGARFGRWAVRGGSGALARRFEPRPLFGRTAAVLACLLVWAVVSALWSADPWRSLALAARLAGVLAAGLALIAAVELHRRSPPAGPLVAGRAYGRARDGGDRTRHAGRAPVLWCPSAPTSQLD